MSEGNVFSYIKSVVKLSDYVSALPQCKGLRRESPGVYRTNNIIINGGNSSSMKIDDNKGTFTCYSGDKEFGDIITLYRILNGGESIGMFDACLQLAEEQGIEIPSSLLGKSSGPKKADSIKFVDIFADLCHEELIKEIKNKGKLYNYLKERGASGSIVKKWKLGYIPIDAANKMVDTASEGIPREAVLAAGICNEDNFVSMAGRLVFPIFAKNGKAISLSSRVIPGVKCYNQDSKYINTKSTHIYDKGATLYGQHLISRTSKSIIICEGNLDVIAINEVLPENHVAVAVCGSSLTIKHELLLSGAESVALMFDSDDAGRAATRKAVWLADKTNLSIARIPQGSDPWDLYINNPGDLKTAALHTANFLAGAVRMASQDLDHSDLENWVKHSYSELGYKSSRRSFVKALKEFSDLTDESIEALTDESKMVAKRHYTEPSDDKILSGSTKVAVSSVLGLSSGALNRIFGYISEAGEETRTRFIKRFLPVSTDTDIQAINTVMVDFKGNISNELRGIIEQEYPENGAQLDRDTLTLAASVASKCSLIVDSDPGILDKLPEALLELYSKNMDIAAGASLDTAEETLHMSVMTAESIFTEMAKD